METTWNDELQQVDMVNSPNHYRSFPKETWEMMVDIWGVDNFVVYCEINAFKYKMRAGEKPGQSVEQDLQKAEWYLKKANDYRK